MFEVTIPHLEQVETKMIFEGKDKNPFLFILYFPRLSVPLQRLHPR